MMSDGNPRVVNMMGLKVKKVIEQLDGPDKIIVGTIIGQPSGNCYYLLSEENQIHSCSYPDTEILEGQAIEPTDIIYFEEISQLFRESLAEVIAQTYTRGLQ